MTLEAEARVIPDAFFRASGERWVEAALPASLRDDLRRRFPDWDAQETLSAGALLCLLRMQPEPPLVLTLVDEGAAPRSLVLRLSSERSLAAAMRESLAELAAVRARGAPLARGGSRQVALVFKEGGSEDAAVDAQVAIRPSCAGLACRVRGGAEAEWLARALLQRILRLLQAAAERPDCPLGDAEYLGESDRAVVSRWLQPVRRAELLSKTLPELFTESAQAYPANVAVVTAERSYRYDELAAAAAALASRLREHDVAGRPVGLLLPRGYELVVACWGVLAAQGICVFLDLDHPAARRGQIEDDAGLALIVSSAAEAPTPSFQLTPTTAGRTVARVHPVGPSHPGEVAALIYTSGSTGQPKGVRLTHQGVAGAARWLIDQLFVGPQRSLGNAPIGSVAALFEIVLALLQGGALVLPGREAIRDSRGFVAALRAHRVNHFYVPPSFLRLLLLEDELLRCSALQVVTVGGEAVPKELVAAFFRTLPGVRLTHNYGLSEVSASSLFAELSPSCELALLDRLCPNHTLRLVDERGQLVPVGVSGEIVLGGSGVTPGYARATAGDHRLTVDPTSAERLYHTGDRAFLLPSGALCFLGRRDFQVQLHGQRIELAEVDGALRAIPEIVDALTVAQAEAGVVTSLCAYVVARAAISASRLRSALLAVLPAAMCPSMFVQLAALPRAPGGKLDRRALPAPSRTNLLRSHPFEAPRSELEKTLAESWARVLSLEVACIGIDDSFYELGGDSVRALELLVDAARLGVRFGVQVLAAGPTIRALASRVGADRAAPRFDLEDAPLSLTEGQRNLCAWAETCGGIARLNLPIVYSLRGPVDVARVHAALQQVVAVHSALRIGFSEGDGQLQPQVASHATIALEPIDADGQSVSALLREFMAGLAGPMNLLRPPLVTARLVRTAPDAYLLQLTANHLIFDGNCYGLLFRALARAYAGPLSEESSWRFEDFARAEALRVGSPEVAAHREELTACYDRILGTLRAVPLPDQDPVAHSFHRHSLLLTGAVVRGEGTLFHALLGAFQLAYHALYKIPSLLTSVSVSGRTRLEHVELIGCLMTDVIVATEWNESASRSGFFASSRAAWQDQIVAHFDAPVSYRTLVECVKRLGHMAVLPSFNMTQPEQVSPLEVDGVRWAMVPPEEYLTSEHAETAGLVALTVTVLGGGACHLEFTGRDDVLSRDELLELSAVTCRNAQEALHAGRFTATAPEPEHLPLPEVGTPLMQGRDPAER
jgi:amino acid adenylation domain-containing protein